MKLKVRLPNIVDKQAIVNNMQFNAQQDGIIIGYVAAKSWKPCPPKAVFNYIIDLQRDTSLKLIEKLFSDEFSEVIDILSGQDTFVEKVRDQFDTFISLMDSKEALIKPFLLKMCKNNSDFGDWVINKQLLSMDTSLIKNQQIQMLTQLIQSREKGQLAMLFNIKTFILREIESKKGQEFSDDEQNLLKNYIKLLINSLNRWASAESSDTKVTLEFQVSDIDNLVTLMHKSKSQSLKLKLTRLIIMFLSPEKCFENKTITLTDYIDKLVAKNEEGNLLFISLVASNNKNILDSLIGQKTVESQIKNLLSDCNPNSAQFLYNLSKQKQFIETYHSTLTMDIYHLLKKQVKSINSGLLPILISTLTACALHNPETTLTLAKQIKEDFTTHTGSANDILFMQSVILPLLQAEEKVNVALNFVKADGKTEPVKVGDGVTGGCTYMFPSKILDQKQQALLQTKFKEITEDHLESFSEVYASSWDLVYEEEDHQTNVINIIQQFDKFLEGIDSKKNIFMIFETFLTLENNKREIYGFFTNQNNFESKNFTMPTYTIQMPHSKANFFFNYSDKEDLHYQVPESYSINGGSFVTCYNDGPSVGGEFVTHDTFIHMFFTNSQQIDQVDGKYSVECLEKKFEQSMNKGCKQCKFGRIEVWSPDANLSKKKISSGSDTVSVSKSNVFYQKMSPLNFFNSHMIFEVSINMPLSHFALQTIAANKLFLKSPPTISDVYPSSTLIKDLIQPDTNNLLYLSYVEDPESDKKQSSTGQPDYISVEPINNSFLKIDGLSTIIEVAKKAIGSFKVKEVREMWTMWINEIESFSQIEGFMSKLAHQKLVRDVINDLIARKYEFKVVVQENKVKEQEKFVADQKALNSKVVSQSLKAISEVFDDNNSSALRQEFFSNGTLSRFLDRLGQLSSEKKRSKAGSKIEAVQEETKTEKAKEIKKEPKQGSGPNNKQIKKKKKGVGYTTENGQLWDVDAYLKTKEAKNAQASSIIQILTKIIKSSEWQASEEVRDLLLESAFLPNLESALRSGSLLEMIKEFELNMSYLKFIEELALNQVSLLPLLQEIGEDYSPRQIESVGSLLSKIDELATIFLSCMSDDNNESGVKLDAASVEDQKKPKEMAEEIKKINSIVQGKLKETNKGPKVESIKEILALPLSEAYFKLLAGERYNKVNMKNSHGEYDLKYRKVPIKLEAPVPAKIVRLSQEIADLSKSLPCDHTNAIFCRVDRARVDVMRCIIMGARDTPYAHGAFMYELVFENTYPQKPPKCSIITTGGGSVRFNPNLYDDGYVCLSLLGTWQGNIQTENWDPKVSSILQILLSIQAIVMSNEVFFNEPGQQQTMGTPHGEAQNNGYCNIIKYNNVKFAMIDMIKNPPAGFEKAIRGNFYLKKNEILRDVKQWVEEAKTVQATYLDLVSYHNKQWCDKFQEKGKYAQMMAEIYEELKQTLESLPSPFEDQGGVKLERNFSTRDDESKKTEKVAEESKTNSTMAAIEEIDMSYDAPVIDANSQEININDDKVKDRWSRYIGAMGIEAVAKQAQSRILICGLGPLGVEIAKNIVLAGCKELILYDKIKPDAAELSGQFFLTEKDCEEKEHSRAHYSREKLQQLNLYVKVTVITSKKELAQHLQQGIKVAVITDNAVLRKEYVYELNTYCRQYNTCFINASQTGLFGSLFNDFGPEFHVLDKNGEELHEVLIKSIHYDEEKNRTVVTVLDGYKHKFEDSDVIQLKEVQGMKLLNEDGNTTSSINDVKEVRVKVIDTTKFEISEDARKYSNYDGSGIAKQVKVPFVMKFKTMKEIESESSGQEKYFDQSLILSDFTKMESNNILHYIIQVAKENSSEQNQGACLDLVMAKLPNDLKEKPEQKKLIERLVCAYFHTENISFAPISAFIGGVVSQEIVKAITQKFTPINQYFYYDCSELYNGQDICRDQDWDFSHDNADRYSSVKKCLGPDLLEKIKNCNLFMIGAGAIGCELLKNYAMLGLGTQGKIVLTDPDVIEVSNLNRQFLFREKHLRKPKSQTAAAAAIQMNPHLKGRIEARLDKVCDQTIATYNEKFFKSQTIVTNALDNIQARIFIDQQCVASRTALVDSGTLGPKGHVQIIVPHLKTESYNSQRDPDENGGEIPQCTLKMFPEETLHCVEWAKSMFGDLFTLKPQSFNKLINLEKDHPVNLSDQQEKQIVKKVLKMIEKQPLNFDDCIRLARLRFQKHFYNDVKQLLLVYPLDKQNEDGKPFWSLPKRPPTEVIYDHQNEMHQNVIAAFSSLFAKMYGIKIPYEHPRNADSKADMAEKASKVPVPSFVPNDQKASLIQAQVDKAKQGFEISATQLEEEALALEVPQLMGPSKSYQEIQELESQFKSVIEPLRKSQKMRLEVEEFEKDNDENFHIDFIHAVANVRAANYKLEEMKWITVKIKAGKIVPALATTTAAIAGLQTIEVIKYLKDSKLEEYRYSFLNLSVPSLVMSEPGLAAKTKLGTGDKALEVTLWDRWDYNATTRNVTLLDIAEYLESTYKLEIRDIFYGAMSLFMFSKDLYQTRDDRDLTLGMISLVDETQFDSPDKDKIEHIDLIVTFVDPQVNANDSDTMINTSSQPEVGEQIIQGVPLVRVNLPPKV